MHVERNVCNNIIRLLLELNDTTGTREDLIPLGSREDLWLKDETPAPTKKDPSRMKAFKPAAPWVLDDEEKKIFIKRVKSLKLPSRFACNVAGYFGDKRGDELQPLKSHDYHILLEHVIPLALRGLLALAPRRAIYRLYRIFQHIGSPVLDPKTFPNLLTDVCETLCLLGKEFPPTLFTISLHLTYHLVKEVILCGVIHTRWMFPIEQNLKVLKNLVKNLARPEGSISESYWLATNVRFLREFIPHRSQLRYDTIEDPIIDYTKGDVVILERRGSKEIKLTRENQQHIETYLLNNDVDLQPWKR
jgi:hypothetical protein